MCPAGREWYNEMMTPDMGRSGRKLGDIWLVPEGAADDQPMASEHFLPHACTDIITMIADPHVPLVYLFRFREYGIQLDGGSAIQEIVFCPFCGQELPGSLRDAFFDRLDDLGLEPEDPSIPSDMQSDAWWRTNGEL